MTPYPKIQEPNIEEGFIERLRRLIESEYQTNPTGGGNSFGEILCYEIHVLNITFADLSTKWGISLSTLGELIWDHCKRLEPDPSCFKRKL